MTTTSIELGLLAALCSLSMSCSRSGASARYDASGVFEARETIISAQVAGQILSMPIEEGQEIAAQTIAAQIDCSQLKLQKAQLMASELAIAERTREATPQLDILRAQEKSVAAQLAVQREQLKVLGRERKRFVALVAAQAAPTKQLSDIEGKIAVLKRQMISTSSQISISRQKRTSYSAQVDEQNRATSSARAPTQASIAKIEDQIRKCTVHNPIAGTVLTKYAEQFELAVPGKPLYKVANLKTMILRAYVSGDQLSELKLNQKMSVFVDAGHGSMREFPGTLSWISTNAEFTPRTIQTKNERANLVYAIKVRVANDGRLKVGMYGELVL